MDRRRSFTSLTFRSRLSGDMHSKQNACISLALKVRLVPVSFEDPQFKSSFNQSASLFAKYQMSVHKDTPSDCGENEVQFPACTFLKTASSNAQMDGGKCCLLELVYIKY